MRGSMQGWLMAGLMVVSGISACTPAEDATPRRLPDETLMETPPPPPAPELPAAVIDTREAILDAARAGSLRRLSRLAEAQPAFLSNFGDVPHGRHWDLMRRTGFDPNRTLVELFEKPHAAKQVGDETWYIWPDLAARSSAELQPERLSFRDKARLETLVGEAGIAAIRGGSPYPGVRTAISETGTWHYFLHEVAEEGDTP